MKKIVLGTLVMLMCWGNAISQQSPYRIVSEDYNQLLIRFASGQIEASPATINGNTFTALTMDGATQSLEVGYPNLPTFSALIEVPLCENFFIEISNAIYDTIALSDIGADHLIIPLQPSRSKSDTSIQRLVMNKKCYADNRYFGEKLAMIEPIGIARDRNLARLQVSPIRYNPVEGTLIVCRECEITVQYRNADKEATLQLFQRHHSPLFSSGAMVINSLYPKSVTSSTPIRYLIVAHSMFRNHLDSFVAWKKRKGFLTDIVYTDDPSVGTTTSSIANYIHSQYNNATNDNPAPTFVLLVGDHEQIPAFASTTTSNPSDHISDLPYMLWTGNDFLPDCYYGRFSAQNVSQLTPQIEKTLMYEQYAFADPSFLDRAVMVAGVDGGNSGDYGFTHADPTMDYAITNYVNGAHGFSTINYFKNDTTIVPSASNVTIDINSSSNSANVRRFYNMGAGLINYTAHGSATSWGTPNFSTSHVGAMTNNQKYGLMIGNCCLTNKFETSTCLGEALLRKDNYCGAVGYIGGSNSTYWYEDVYWSVGLRSSISPTMSLAYNSTNLGIYDRWFHTHGEAFNQWTTTQGQILMMGNMAVESSTSSLKHYYWEIYHLMGDPSVMPYRTQASQLTLTTPTFVPSGSTTLPVTAVPYAYVAMTDTTTHSIIAATYANATGMATLNLPVNLAPGGYEIVAWAQQYRLAFNPVTVTTPDNAYVITELIGNTLEVGDTLWLQGRIINLGNSDATNVTVNFSTNEECISILTDSLNIAAIAAGDTLTLDSILAICVAYGTADMRPITISTQTSFDSALTPLVVNNLFTCIGPKIVVKYIDAPHYLMPGQTYTFNVQLSNRGHQDMPAYYPHFSCNNPLIEISGNDTAALALAIGDSVTRQYVVHVSTQMPYNIMIAFNWAFSTPTYTEGAMLPILVGEPAIETFEGMVFHLEGWAHDTHPWVTTNAAAYQGSSSARSFPTLTHNENSVLSLTRNYTLADSISFYYSVSSEANYDKFHFAIDGIEQIVQSGNVNWTRASFPIAAGTHTFEFTYSKDVSINTGSDCAWIDFVTVPQHTQPWRTAYDTICYGQTIAGLNTYAEGNQIIVDTTNDTLVITQYHILPILTQDSIVEVCNSFTWNNEEYSDSATFTDTITGQDGCQYALSTHFVVHHSNYDTLLYSGCDEVMGHTQSTMYSDTLTNVNGCDSIVTTIINVNHSQSSYDEVVLPGGSFIWDEEEYTTSGDYTHNYQTTEGCDSIVTIHLIISTESISDAEIITVEAYPNPTSGIIHFNQDIAFGIVYDINGKEMLTATNTDNIDLSTLGNGVYTIRIHLHNGQTGCSRVVVRR